MPMLLPGTEMHIVTFVFTLLEIVMFSYQLIYYLSRPQDQNRLWYLILLFLLIVYNITGGLFPDKNIDLPIIIQNIIAYGSGFLMASYFPYYFYRAFNLKSLRFHAIYGVLLFLIIPYLVFFVIVYSVNGNLHFAIENGIVVPFFYSIVVLWAILKAIRLKYKENRNKNNLMEVMAVYCAVIPWASLTVFSYYGVGQLTEVIFTNGGFIVITILFISQSIARSRKEYKTLQELNLTLAKKVHEKTLQLRLENELQRKNFIELVHNIKTLDRTEPLSNVESMTFEQACKLYNLTSREIDIVRLIRQGYKYKMIAETLFISERTVTKHVQNIFDKVGVSNKVELINKLVA